MFSFLATIGSAGSYWLVRRDVSPAGASRAHLCRLSDGEAGTLVGSGLVPHLYAFDVAVPDGAPALSELVLIEEAPEPSLRLTLPENPALGRDAFRTTIPDCTPEEALRLARGLKLGAAA